MIIGILYFAVFFLLWIRYRKKAKGSVGALLLFFYLLSALMTFLIEISDTFNKTAELDWRSTSYYLICVLISLAPFLILGKYDSRKFYFSQKLMRYLSLFLIIFGLIELSISIKELYNNRAMIAMNIVSLREGFYDTLGDVSNNSFFQKILIFVIALQYMSPFCSIYNFSRGKKRLAIWTAVASLCVPVHGMTIGEREAILVFFSNWAFCYFFFRSEIEKTVRSRIKRIGALLMAPFVLFFFAMSFGRFESSSDGVVSGFLSYGGKQPYFFSYLFNTPSINDQKLGGRFCFQYLFPSKERAWRQLNEYISADEYLNQFGGLPGSMFLDFGYMSILVISAIALVYYIIIKKAKMSNGQYPFYLLFLFYFSYQVVFMNIFYLDYTYLPRILLNVMFFLIAFFFSEKNIDTSFK